MTQDQWKHFETVTRFALDHVPPTYLNDRRSNLERTGVVRAVARRDTPAIFNWLVDVSQFQGVADASAIAFARKHGLVRWDDVRAPLDATPSCPRLRSFWTFEGCGYRKAARSCAEPRHFRSCSLPKQPARKGALAVAAVALGLFVRDVCGDDFVGWIDARLAEADPGHDAPHRAEAMGSAVLAALRGVYGLGDKVWSLALADLLLAADPTRERWVSTGAGMVVIDSLFHAYLHRTGVLRRFRAEHAYGPRCYAPGGCADLVRGLARRINARRFNPTFPAEFPRLVQFAIWRLCSTSEMNICNGVQIDDRRACANQDCPTFSACDRVPLSQEAAFPPRK